MKSYKTLSILATSWIRIDNYIKVPHSSTLREVFLTNEKADIFELIDMGFSNDEILDELSLKYKNLTLKFIEKTIVLFLTLKLVQEVDQFN